MENTQTDAKIYGVYIKSLLSQKVFLTVQEVGKNVKQILEKKIIKKNEGKCIPQGYIRPKSVKIISYSSGIVNSSFIEFQAIFECLICHPVEGMIIECVVKTITKAGIHAEVVTDDVVPITVFIARDHHNMNRNFNSIKENSKITAKVIGVRFELNDSCICVIAGLYEKERITKKPGVQANTVKK